MKATDIKHAARVAPNLHKRKAIVLVSVMKDGRVPDAGLMDLLGVKSPNAAGYYRKSLEKDGIIRGYTALIDWKKLGYPSEFLVTVEGQNIEANYDIEKEIVAFLDDYAKKNGDVFILPSGNGRVIISEIFTCFGERPMTLIIGHATSEQDAITFSRYYIAEKFLNAKVIFMLVKGRSIQNFFIQQGYINFMKGSFAEEKTLTLPEEFKKRFPSLTAVKGKNKAAYSSSNSSLL